MTKPGQPQRGDLPVSSLHLSVAGEVKQSIDDIASKSGWSKSYLVEQILRNYLKLPADYDWSDLELVKSGKFE